jgi:hypothetical protein
MVEGRQVSIDKELRPGERVLWVGHPQGSLLTPQDAYLIPFSLVWVVFISFAAGAALRSGSIISLGVVPFVAIGLYLSVGRFLFKKRKRERTLYAVTNERVLEKSGETVRCLSLSRLPALEVTSGAARGRIIFGSIPGAAGAYANTGLDWFAGGLGAMPMAFFDIPDAATVGRTMEDAAKAA